MVRNGHGTLRNGQERSWKRPCKPWTLNGQERLGMFESERKNALERAVENVHGTLTVLSRSRFKNDRNTVDIKKYKSKKSKRNYINSVGLGPARAARAVFKAARLARDGLKKSKTLIVFVRIDRI